ncbi:MAG: hypothetical protein AAGJ80_19425 [Cyanobacteria bacterium J06553_1]
MQKSKREVRVGGKMTLEDTFFEIWTAHGRIETLTIGKMPAMQIQIYNKSLEIAQIGGKEWFRDLWRLSPDYRPGETVFRLEVRMTKPWLKQRRARTINDIRKMRKKLWADALINNRLVDVLKDGKKTKDQRLCRRDTHPLWDVALKTIGDHDLPPIGRRTTGRREALRDMLIAQLAGTPRSTTVLSEGGYDFNDMMAIAEEAMLLVEDDDGHLRKLSDAALRYEEVDGQIDQSDGERSKMRRRFQDRLMDHRDPEASI